MAEHACSKMYILCFTKTKLVPNIRSTGTVFYSLLYLNSQQGFDGLKYMRSVISVIVDSLPGNTKNRESTRSWTARVRLVHSWAVKTHTQIYMRSLFLVSYSETITEIDEM